MSSKKETKKSDKSTTATGKMKSKGFTDDEKAAMKERAQELKAEARRGQRGDKADEEREVLAKIAEMTEPDRSMAGELRNPSWDRTVATEARQVLEKIELTPPKVSNNAPIA